MAPMVRDGFAFSRKLEHASVSIDCGAMTSDIQRGKEAAEIGMV